MSVPGEVNCLKDVVAKDKLLMGGAVMFLHYQKYRFLKKII